MRLRRWSRSGTAVVNNFQSANISSDKLFGSLALARAGIPTPRTFVAFTEEAALKSLEELGYPAESSRWSGAGGDCPPFSRTATSPPRYWRTGEYMYPMYQVYYLQEFVKRPPQGHKVVRRGRPDGGRDLSTFCFRLADEHSQGRQGGALPDNPRAERALAPVREGRRGGDRRGRPHGVPRRASSSTRSTARPSSRTPFQRPESTSRA
jgi:hypothetical protein